MGPSPRSTTVMTLRKGKEEFYVKKRLTYSASKISSQTKLVSSRPKKKIPKSLECGWIKQIKG